MATKDAKSNLRKDIKSKLSQVTPEEITSQSTRALRQILDLPQYHAATRLSIYLSMPSREAETSILVHDALSKDKKVFVPYIHRPPGLKRKIIDMLRLSSVEDYESLERDSWGIPSLSAESIEGRENAMGGFGIVGGEVPDVVEDRTAIKSNVGMLDVIVVPAVAFDEGMRRLGHGGGFYDMFLGRCCSDERRKPFLVGLCLAEQMLPAGQEIPITHDDWIVDAVAVGDGRLLRPRD